jgi:hypothetical protein
MPRLLNSDDPKWHNLAPYPQIGNLEDEPHGDAWRRVVDRDTHIARWSAAKMHQMSAEE